MATTEKFVFKDIPCMIKSREVCDPSKCTSHGNAKQKVTDVIDKLISKYNMNFNEALEEYKAGDPVFRWLKVSDEIANTCNHSLGKKSTITTE